MREKIGKMDKCLPWRNGGAKFAELEKSNVPVEVRTSFRRVFRGLGRGENGFLFKKIYYTAEVIETILYSGVMSMLLVYGEYVCIYLLSVTVNL